MIWLRSVLVPLGLALFLMLVLEPLLYYILNPPRLCARCSARARSLSRRFERDRMSILGLKGRGQQPANSHSYLSIALWRFWSGIAVVACILLVAIFMIGCLFLIYRSLLSFQWKKYNESLKLKRLLQGLNEFG